MAVKLLKRLETSDTAQTESLGAWLGELIEREIDASSDRNFTFIALYGDLGAGKTAFTRGLASVLAPSAYVRSPTYTLVNEYSGDKAVISHFDVYRISDEDDLYSTGFYDYFPDEDYFADDFRPASGENPARKASVMAVEWCEKIPYALPKHYYRVAIEKTGDDKRAITIEEIEE